MRKLILVFSIVALFASCQKDALIPTPPAPPIVIAKPVTYLDLSYGSQALQKMDIYLPEGRTTSTTKTIVLIHGGAWIGGDKTEMTFIVDSIKKRKPDFAFVNINYRLAINGAANVFPTQEVDVKAAIDFYLAKTATYEVSKDLILLGASAGGHLALLHGYKNDPEKHVKAVVDFYGPTDLVAMWNEGFIMQFGLIVVVGNSYTGNPSIYTQSSPVNYITAQSPPTIVLQGLMDELVSPSQSTILIDKLNTAGVSHQLVTYPNEGHGFSDADNTDALNKIMPFLATYVK
jgi:acetyl esterase/lipase